MARPLEGVHLAALLLAVLMVSSAAILARECDAPAPTVALYRMGLTALAVLPFTLIRHRRPFERFDGRSALLSVLAGALLGFHYVAWFTSLERTSVASSVILVSIHPLVVAVLAGQLVRERVALPALLAILLSLGGAVLVSAGDLQVSGDHFVGDLLALVGGVLFAFYFLAGRVLRKKLPLLPYMLVVYGAATVTVGLYCVVRSLPLVGFDGRTYLLFGLLALVPTLIGHSLFNWALRYVRAHLVSLSQLGEPIGATLLAFLLLGETPRWSFYPAAALILAGIGVLVRQERKS